MLDYWDYYFGAREDTLDYGLATKIMKETLSFVPKAWWNLVWHQLTLTIRDNVLSLDIAALVVNIIESFEIDVTKILERETRDWAMNMHKT